MIVYRYCMNLVNRFPNIMFHYIKNAVCAKMLNFPDASGNTSVVNTKNINSNPRTSICNICLGYESINADFLFKHCFGNHIKNRRMVFVCIFGPRERVPRFGGMMTTDILKLWWGWRFWNGADEDDCLLRFWIWNDVTAISIIFSVSWTITTKMMLNFICIMEIWFLSYLISFLLLMMMMIVCVMHVRC